MMPMFREPVSGLTHLGGAIVALAGVIVLLILGWGSIGTEISLFIYGASLVLMFSASAAYHLVKSRPGVVQWLRKLDHSAIYLLIAGTYTPVCLRFFSGAWLWGMLTVIWTMALAGIVVKLFIIGTPRWVTAGLYLLMGWLAVAGVREMVSVMPAGALAWLLAGGLLFTAGAVVYILRFPDLFPGIFGFHELWHVFVILGCACHYVVVAAYVAA